MFFGYKFCFEVFFWEVVLFINWGYSIRIWIVMEVLYLGKGLGIRCKYL